MSHTPGPWCFFYEGSSTWAIGSQNDAQEFPPFARVCDSNDERARANVLLIVAAPRLLAALRELVAAVDADEFDYENSRGTHPDALGDARLAILQATTP